MMAAAIPGRSVVRNAEIIKRAHPRFVENLPLARRRIGVEVTPWADRSEAAAPKKPSVPAATGLGYITRRAGEPGPGPAEAALRPLSFDQFSGQDKRSNACRLWWAPAKRRRRGAQSRTALRAARPRQDQRSLSSSAHELGKNVRVDLRAA